MRYLLLSVLVVCVIGFFVIPQAFAQSYIPTVLILDPIPSSIYTGHVVTFTGGLISNGQPLANEIVYIYEDDRFKPDQLIGYGKTNSNGQFSISWKVTKGLVETDFDIYAHFDGSNQYASTQTPRQEMSVYRYLSGIQLNQIPSSVAFGEQVIFSGRVTLEKGSPEGFVVYVMDEDPYTRDDLLTTAYVKSDGSFSANWVATYVDENITADVYAVFEGTEVYYRSTTCDTGITFDFGGSCSNTIQIVIQQPTQVPAPPTPPTPSSGGLVDDDGYVFKGD
ncbi:uncharacterized protein METZ01_LOCUS369359, partial [marine metagenome]